MAGADDAIICTASVLLIAGNPMLKANAPQQLECVQLCCCQPNCGLIVPYNSVTYAAKSCRERPTTSAENPVEA